MNKKWQGRVDSAYKWMKIGGVSILVITGAYAFGTFKPNTLAVDRITKSVEQTQVEWAKNLGLHEPSFEYKNNVQFVKALNKCIDYLNFTTPLEKRVPIEMITAQAALESAWGMSRFAKEANNLFGIKTWDKDKGILPLGYPESTPWRIRKFETKCGAVKEYIRLLNEHKAYKEFRELRAKMIEKGEQLDPIILIATLDRFSTTEDYDKRVIRIIKKVRDMETIVATNDEVTTALENGSVLPKTKPKDE